MFSGYIGHIASKHSELLADSSPVLTNSQVLAYAKDNPRSTPVVQEVKQECDPELVIPKSSVPNYQPTVVKHVPKSNEAKRTARGRGTKCTHI